MIIFSLLNCPLNPLFFSESFSLFNSQFFKSEFIEILSSLGKLNTTSPLSTIKFDCLIFLLDVIVSLFVIYCGFRIVS